MKIPVATYRLQFNPDYGFQKAHAIIPYLSELGISDIYASPVFKAKKGSSHGYDVVALNQLNTELGTDKDFDELIGALKNAGMGWIQDFVPNHMAFDGENHMLMDILENGSHSEYYGFFDIEWEHSYESIRGRLLAPFLGRPYGESMEDGEITVRYDNEGFSINYYELRLPLKIESYVNIITHRLTTLKKSLGEDHPDFIKLLGILYSLKNLTTSREEIFARYNQIRFIKKILWELYNKNHDVKNFFNENLRIFNGEKGNPESFNMLDSLLSEQLFKLSFWKVASEEINYRRFFNINNLISLRMEDEHVFNHAHSLILSLLKDGKCNGLRIDHIDGLYDPTGYLKRLRERAGDTYIVVEKILGLKETLPSFWQVQGTTGYDFLNYVNRIFCDVRNGRKFNKIYYNFTGFKISYETLIYKKKKLIIEKDMTGDVDNLAHLLKKISSRDRNGSDITLYGLKRAIIEILALFPVYRTYVSQDVSGVSARSHIRKAVKKARDKNPQLFHELNFIERFLQLQFRKYLSDETKRDWVFFFMRFQQVTAPLMAKGFEDTTLYVYNRLMSLNEVGGSPDTFGMPVEGFHSFNEKRAVTWPHSMNTTSTHDTKRGEDVRARINVLSEIPQQWEANLKKWNKLNQKKKKMLKGKLVPDRNDEYMLYQTLLGAFPFHHEESHNFVERIKLYIIKAVREAKFHTAWLKPDIKYEEIFLSFIDELLKQSDQNYFLKEFLLFQKKIAYYGIYNSLAQILIKITSPGVPDFYQGTELWELNLVDPDNRRPVDFTERTRLLQEIKAGEIKDTVNLIHELLSSREDGRIKLFLIYRALMARKKHSALFEKGAYIPLETDGKHKDSIVAFAREHKPLWSITIAPRFLTGVVKEDEYPLGTEVWDNTHIVVPEEAPSSWKEEITGLESEGGQTIAVGEVLKYFPCALLLHQA
ncbi:MAG: malto-oligosyltrehalose synthase [Thermodesulfovibrionia bacterium]|nr:malto-oligosyltrehalose synthase [Thermodesulfovibrionia bacterium]